MQNLKRLVYGCALLALFSVAVTASAAQVRTIKGGFADVKERVVMALENRGLVLNYTARVGDMLDRTGRDLGRTQRIYGQAEVLEFCSAALSRSTMEADPHNIVLCPYAIAIYTLPQASDTVYVSYRPLGNSGSEQSTQALRAVDKLLADVVAEALQ